VRTRTPLAVSSDGAATRVTVLACREAAAGADAPRSANKSVGKQRLRIQLHG